MNDLISKSFTLFFFVFLVIANCAQAQNPYQDAILLSQQSGASTFNIEADQDAINILGNYFEDSTFTSNTETLINGVQTCNNFFKVKLSSQLRESVNADEGQTSRLLASFSNPGGLNVTTLADGLALFIVERARHELSLAFFDEFREQLTNKDYRELEILFPETIRNLKLLENEFYNPGSILPVLHEAFRTDLRNIMTHFPKALKNRALNCETSPVACALLDSGIKLVQEIENGTHIAEIAKDPEFINEFSKVDNNLVDIINIFNFFSDALRSEDPDRYWISGSDLRKMNATQFRIFLGLAQMQLSLRESRSLPGPTKPCRHSLDGLSPEVSQSLFTIGEGSRKKLFKDVLVELGEGLRSADANVDEAIETFSTLESYIHSISKAAVRVDDLLNQTQQNSQDKTNPEVYLKYATASVEVINELIDSDLMDRIGISNDMITTVDTLLIEVNTLNAMYYDIKRKAYTAAAMKGMYFLSKYTAIPQDVERVLLRNMSFISAMATAETPQEVKDTFEAFALPPGSASIKKRTDFNIAVNSYLGFAGGVESLDGKGGFVTAVSAPVGIAFSNGRDRKGCDCRELRGSHTLFFSLIDIGAITAYRFDDENSAVLPKVTLSNIFAPGVSLIHGFKRWPISIGATAQLGPALREVNESGLELRNKRNFRTHIFMAVDIPLFNVYTRH